MKDTQIKIGEKLREILINKTGLSVKEAAEYLKMTRVNLQNILNGKTKITPRFIVLVSLVFDKDIRNLYETQMLYELFLEQKKLADLNLKPFNYES